MSEPTSDKARLAVSRRVVRRLREDPLFAAFVKDKSEGSGSIVAALPTDTMGTIFEWLAEIEAPAIVCFEELDLKKGTLSVLIFREGKDGAECGIEEVVRVAPTIALSMFGTFAREKGRVSIRLAEPDLTVYAPDAMATL